MIVYNITTKINQHIEKQWIEWQRKENIPAVMATGLFTDHKFFRLLEQDETEEITYVIQYLVSSIDQYKKFIEEFALSLNEKAFIKWNDQFISFETIMQIVN